MNKVTVVSIASLVLGSLPLLAFAFFSPGLDSEGPWGYIIFSFGFATFVGLIVSARRRKWIWGLVLMQAIILGLVLYETFSDAALYIGT